jgi:hypothetical protein
MITVWLFFAGSLFAQESDLLDQAKRMDKVAAQKLEADLRQALREAERLSRSDRPKAVECLKRALAQLEDDTLLSPQRREALKRMFKDQIRITESATNARSQENDKKPSPSEPRGASAPARPHPQDVVQQATEQTTRTAEQVLNARRLQKDRERQLASGYRDIDNSATLPKGDIEYPKDWQERTKGRTTTVQLTAKERSILQALNTTISVNFRNSKLEDVIEYLQTYTGQPILLDREGMKDLEISYETAVTLNLKGVTVRTVLRKILADVGMSYLIKDETIQATSAQKAREMMTVRRYYVGDLLAGMSALGNYNGPQGVWNTGIFPNGFRAPGLNPQLQAMRNMEGVKQLIDLVQGSVDPQSWQVNGGSGTVTFHVSSMSLIIKQSAEVHALLGSGGLLR